MDLPPPPPPPPLTFLLLSHFSRSPNVKKLFHVAQFRADHTGTLATYANEYLVLLHSLSTQLV